MTFVVAREMCHYTQTRALTVTQICDCFLGITLCLANTSKLASLGKQYDIVTALPLDKN